jgi:hypothetical protein
MEQIPRLLPSVDRAVRAPKSHTVKCSYECTYASNLPSGEKATWSTRLPRRVERHGDLGSVLCSRPAGRSQSFTHPSQLPDAKTFPSGENATLLTTS